MCADDAHFCGVRDRCLDAQWRLVFISSEEVRIIGVDKGLIARLRESGFAVLAGFFDPGPLTTEVTDALADGFSRLPPLNVGSAGNAFRYVPMMCERTARSLALLDGLSGIAGDIFGRPAVPLRAKGTQYHGSTAWHRDSERNLDSLGFMAYLEPLQGDTGALRVLPGSHRPSPVDAPGGYPTANNAVGEPVETEPGDVIVFDEHLLHASAGGTIRHQWRVDFFADPQTSDETLNAEAFLAGVYQVGWDGGYDLDRYPSYDTAWRQCRRPAAQRLRQLGAYRLADAEENAARASRTTG
jgi:Phytanoyl-CoA dioxygenase (PhyH)